MPVKVAPFKLKMCRTCIGRFSCAFGNWTLENIQGFIDLRKRTLGSEKIMDLMIKEAFTVKLEDMRNKWSCWHVNYHALQRLFLMDVRKLLREKYAKNNPV